MSDPLPREFFAQDVLTVAPALLGCTVERGGVRVRITETEAYAGYLHDPGSHAHRGETARTAPMFGPPGQTYVYLSYGMHWLLNLVTGPEGAAQAVLLRAGDVVDGEAVLRERWPEAARRDLCRGPARLARALGLDGRHTSRDFCRPPVPPSSVPGRGPAGRLDLLVRPPSAPVADAAVRRGPRVGVSGAGGEASAYPWRFWIDGDPSVSPYRPAVRRRPSPRAGTG